jgi:hypothetical protein
MNKTVILGCLIAVVGCSIEKKQNPTEPVEHASSSIVDTDPSFSNPESRRYRFVADFNNDGIQDLMISDDLSAFGNSGGPFQLYLGTINGKWKEIGSVHAHPRALNLQKSHEGEGIITVYTRSGGGEGGLQRLSITEKGINEIEGKLIHPDDNGPENERNEYQKYFAEQNRLHGEKSETLEGQVKWIPAE